VTDTPELISDDDGDADEPGYNTHEETVEADKMP